MDCTELIKLMGQMLIGRMLGPDEYKNVEMMMSPLA
jgi:hypothetical protein